jgi:hypothetical protein
LERLLVGIVAAHRPRFLERRYLIIPWLRSSRIYIVDTKPDAIKAKIHKIIEPEEVFKKTCVCRKPRLV